MKRIGFLFLVLVTYVGVYSQTASSCFSSSQSTCCSGNAINITQGSVTYNGNTATLSFTVSIQSSCSVYDYAYINYGDGSGLAAMSPVVTNTFQTSHTYSLNNVCGNSIYTVDICMQGGGNTCQKSGTISIAHPGSTYAINSLQSSCNSFIFSYSGTWPLVNPQWIYGNGAVSAIPASTVITYSYPAAGIYTVYLTGQGIAPCLVSKTVAVSNFPGADFSYSVSNNCTDPPSVTTTISAYNTSLYSYAWTLNGSGLGSFAQVDNFTSGFVAGTNTLTLSVNDGTCTSQITKTFNIGSAAGYNISATNMSCLSRTLAYSGSPALQNAQWSFGDGSYSSTITTGSNSVAHTYPGSGTYVVTLNGYPVSPCFVQTLVTVTDFTVADFNYTVVNVCSPSAGVILSIPNYNSSYSYMWQINLLNIPATGATGTYAQNLTGGTNIIKLFITSGACVTSVSKNITIASPNANFSITSPSLCLGDMLSVFGVTGGAATYSWTITKPGNVAEPIQTGMNPFYTFTTAGAHAITLTITNTFPGNITCSTTASQNLTVYTLPQADFTTTPITCNNAVTVSLSNPATTFNSYTINYGDGTSVWAAASSISSGNRTHTYTPSSSFTVYPITITLANGPCISQSTENVQINNGSNLSLSPSATYICKGAPVLITSILNPLAPSVGTLSYNWVGPSGFTSTLSSISVTTGGMYNLTVTANGACSLSLTASRSITALADPSATLLAKDNINCTTSSGSATIIIAQDLRRQGYYINGNLTAANSGATGTVQVVISGLTQGPNYITVANALNQNCNSVVLVDIDKTEPSIAVTVSDPLNCSPGTGAVSVVISPATGTVSWYTQSNYPVTAITSNTTSSGATNLSQGAYLVQHIYGTCTTSALFNVAKPIINLGKLGGQGACPTSASPVTLTAQFVPSSITGSYSYTLQKILGPASYSTIGTPGSVSTFSLAQGNYSASVSSNGCLATYSFNVKVLSPLTIALTTNTPTCKDPGSISAAVSGGDGNYNYNWFAGSSSVYTAGSVLGLGFVTAATSISVAVSDNSGCLATAPSSPIVINTVSPVVLATCGTTSDYTLQGNTNATKISTCQIGSCVSGGVGPYLFEWYKTEVQSTFIQWQFKQVGSNFVASSGQYSQTLSVPTSSGALNLALNSDANSSTVCYPYWTFTSTPAQPQFNSVGTINNSAGFGLSGDPLDYYQVTESTTANVAALVGSYSGLSGAEGSNENFTTGDYTLHVTDANGCKYIFNIGTLTFDEPTGIAISFDYVWGINRIQVKDTRDVELAENMQEAAQDMLEGNSKCMAAKLQSLKTYLADNCTDLTQFKDDLTLIYELKDHHHTLYYYDRAGRLTKTVPPQGVAYLSQAEIAKIKANRQGTITNWTVPKHDLATTYNYNTLGQLLSQHTPDGGFTRFIYDSKNRLRFSQNSEQARSTQKYSYTKYDALGRIIEVGESSLNSTSLFFINPVATQITSNLSVADNSVFPSTSTRQVTRTFYSVPTGVDYYGRQQRFVQNRVSYTLMDEDPTKAGDENYTYYSYDIHGNVEWIVQQDDAGMGKNYIGYEYDLVSGKVLKVKYNERRSDRFFHRYIYDAENRLTKVETSRDGEVWDADAKYNYYAHGPLKRMEIGQDKVQGLDYIYTIQGWLKSVNSPNLSTASDPGADNSTSGATQVLERTAADRYGSVLKYFAGDYTTSTTSNFLMTNSNYELASFTSGTLAGQSLYNGNISGWINSQLNTTATNTIAARADLFRYDILNRIRESASKEEASSSWNNISGQAATYKTRYWYDANGNIGMLSRYDDAGARMDSLRYTYDGGSAAPAQKMNRLSQVQDISSSSVNGRSDLQGTHNYLYDSIGNLTQETGQELLNLGGWLTSFTNQINWTVYGKIKDVNKTMVKGGTTYREKIRYRYDGSGNRITKEYWQDAGALDGAESTQETKTTFYIRDAQGNTMAVYERYYDASTSLYKWELSEQPIYGSSRLGENNAKVLLASASNYAALALPPSGPSVISEYQNWITSTDKSQLLPNGSTTDNLCQCRIMSLSNNNANVNYQNVQQAVEFLGIANNGVAVAEDLNRNLQFYVVLAKKYLGGNDACLVFDKTGKLMKNTENITSVDVGSKPVIINIPGTSKYVINHLNVNKQAVYHVVDMALTGYGPVGFSGEVTSANNVIQTYPNSTTYHGNHFSGVEQHVTGHSILYSTRYTIDQVDTTKGTTDIVAYDFGTSTITPQETVIYSTYGCGNTANGELQISPDGSKLGWYRFDKTLAGFTYRNGEIHTIPLNTNKTGPNGQVNIKAISTAGNYGKGPLEFMKNSNDVLYSQRGVYKEGNNPTYDRNIWKYDPINTTTLALNPNPVSPIISYLSGEIKRGVDGNFYVPNMGKKMDKFHSYSTGWNSNITVIDTTFPIASSLPTQVYKFYDPAANADIEHSRTVGKKSYELNDHLGNVRVVISDNKFILDQDASNTVSSSDQFVPEILNYTDYYAFGQSMPSRQFNSGGYRYGFNGKENDNEVKGVGNQQDYGLRIYDTRIGKFLSVDPLAVKYAMLTPYQFASNRPIDGIDLDGLEYNPFMTAWGASRQAAYGNAKTDAERKEVGRTTTSQSQVSAKIGITIGAAMGLGYLGYSAIPYLSGLLTYAATPNGQQVIMEGTSLLVNLFYEGPDDPFPTNGPGGEIGKSFGKYLGGLFKAPVAVGKLFERVAAKGFTFIKGSNSKKTAVIGQGMDRVKDIGAALQNAEVFKPSAGALNEWADLLKNSGGGQISDEVAKGTKLFTENKIWIEKVKKEGYDLIDLGADASGKSSTFYNLEKQTVYGTEEN